MPTFVNIIKEKFILKNQMKIKSVLEKIKRTLYFIIYFLLLSQLPLLQESQ